MKVLNKQKVILSADQLFFTKLRVIHSFMVFTLSYPQVYYYIIRTTLQYNIIWYIL